MKYTNVKKIVLKRFKKDIFLLILLSIILISLMALELIPPLILRNIVDNNIKQNIINGLLKFIIIYISFLSFMHLIRFVQHLLTNLVGQNILFDLRNSIINHFKNMALSFYNKNSTGDLMTRCTADIESVNTMITTGTITMVADIFRIIGMFVAMFLLNIKFTIITIILLPFFFIAIDYFKRKFRESERDTRKTIGIISSNILETIINTRIIKAYGKENKFIKILENSLDRFMNARKKSSFYIAIFPPLIDMLRLVLIVILLIIAILSFYNNKYITAGTLVAFINLITRLFFPLREFTNGLQRLQQALSGLERIEELLEEPIEKRPAFCKIDKNMNGNITIDKLDFSYNNERKILKDVNLTIKTGERVTIIGKTGAGKSTLLNLIAGIYQPNSGNILIDKYDPRIIKPSDRRKILGFVPQNVQIFDGSIKDNITLNDKTIDDKKLRNVLEITGLLSKIDHLKDGINTNLGPGGTNLSFGEKQMLSLARALILNPLILLLDEPTSGLDSITEQKILDTIKLESQKRTTITISHRLSGIIDSQRIIVVNDGKIVQDGSPKKLSKEDGWFKMFTTLENLGWE